MTELTRGQRHLIQAHTHVSAIAALYPLEDDTDSTLTDEQRRAIRRRNETPARHRKNYGSLCHGFPVLVHRSGLIQAISFYEAKGAGDGPSKLAYQQLLPHVADLLEPRANDARHSAASAAGLAVRIANLPVEQYMVKTRRLLEAWMFHKQFAESILNVSAASDGGDE